MTNILLSENMFCVFFVLNTLLSRESAAIEKALLL